MPARRAQLLLRSFHAAVAAAHPQLRLPPHLPESPRGRLIIISAGKAAHDMAAVAEQHYRQNVALRGVAVIPHGQKARSLRHIKILRASHPLPDGTSVAAGRAVLREVRSARREDLVLVLLSGGGSSLLGAPMPGLQLAEVRQTIGGLLNAGADVREINIVRRHLGLTAGGRLAAACAAPLRALIASDVVRGRVSDIASGPCAYDSSTCEESLLVLKKYDVQCAEKIYTGLKSGLLETPKESGLFARVENKIISGARESLQAGEEVLRRAGVRVFNWGERAGSARALAQAHVRRCAGAGLAAVISGGEATSRIIGGGGGSGGSNTEFALQAWRYMKEGVSVLSCDTDGIDGNQQAAGVLFTPEHRHRAARLGLNADAFLQTSNSGAFFAQIGALVKTGETGANANDYRACLWE